MEFGTGEDRAQVARQPPGEGICFLLGAGEILADLDEKAGEPPTGDLLVQCVALKRAIIGFVVADAKTLAGQRRDKGYRESRIAIP